MYTKYYLVADLGDGSVSVRWFDDEQEAQNLIEEDPETYGQNDDVGQVQSASEIKVN